MTAVSPIKLALVVVSAMVAGIMNSIAGGGTLVTFPALIALGILNHTVYHSGQIALLKKS